MGKQFLLWTSSYHPRIGGLENASKEYAFYMKEKGWNVHVITNRYPRNLSEQDYLDGIEIVRFSFFHSPLDYIRNHRLDLFFAWLFFKPLTLFKLIVHFFRTRPDVVNLHFPDQQLFECYLLKLMFRFKLIISLHGNEVERMDDLNKKSLRCYFYNKLFYSAEFITGCSQYLLKEFQEIFPQKDSGKCFTVHNGVGELYLTHNVTGNKNNYIFTAARFVRKKGLELLFEAFKLDTDNALLIAGGNEKELNRLELNILKGISLLGKLNPAEMATQLAESKITVIPSIIEPYGIIVAEAICCGSPIVATNVGGIPEVIALATEKLSPNEKEIFNRWVKLVEPNISSIKNGIDLITKNGASIEEYLLLVLKIRSQFHWPLRLNKYQSVIESEISFC
jgi:glycosyltransferase involved in cell wall biosynthesis